MESIFQEEIDGEAKREDGRSRGKKGHFSAQVDIVVVRGGGILTRCCRNDG